MKATNNDHEKAGDNTDVNIGNNNCFARFSNPPSPYKDVDCPTKEPEIITDLSTPQINETGKPKPNYEELENNLTSLKAEIVALKEFIMGEIITVNQVIKSVEETQSRDEVKHLREENSSKTAIIKILSENINHHITYSSNTFNTSIQQNDFTQTPKYPNNAPLRPPKKPVKRNKSIISKNDTYIVSPNRFESLKSDTGSSCFQKKTDNTLLFLKSVIQEYVKPQVEKSNIITFGKNLKNNRRPTICTAEQHLQNYAPHQKIVHGKGSYANIINSNKEKVCIIGDSHLKRINKRKLKYSVGKIVTFNPIRPGEKDGFPPYHNFL